MEDYGAYLQVQYQMRNENSISEQQHEHAVVQSSRCTSNILNHEKYIITLGGQGYLLGLYKSTWDCKVSMDTPLERYYSMDTGSLGYPAPRESGYARLTLPHHKFSLDSGYARP